MSESLGSFQRRITWASAACAVSPVGLAGLGSLGVALTLGDAGPGPPSLTARITNVWPTSLARLVTRRDVVVASLPARSVQLPMSAT